MLAKFRYSVLVLSFGILVGCGSSKSNSDSPLPQADASGSTAESTPLEGAGSGGIAEEKIAVDQPESPLAGSSVPENDSVAAGPNPPFDVTQYLQGRAVTDDNAAPLYIQALSLISGELADTFPPPERAARLAQARSLSKQISDLSDAEKLAANQFSRQQVEQALNASKEFVEKIDLAQSKANCSFESEFSINTLLPHVQAARDLARHSVLQIYHAQKMGDTVTVNAAINRTLRLSRDLQPRGFSVCQLVSIAMDAVALDAIVRLVLNDPKLAAEQCGGILDLLLEHEKKCLNRVDEGLRVEYLVTQATLGDLASGSLTLKTMQELLFGNAASKLTLEQLDFVAERAACDRLFAIALREAESPYREIAGSSQYEAEINKFKEQVRINPQGIPFITIMMAAPLGSLREAVTRSEAQLAGVQLLCALRHFEISHGFVAQSLQEAVAETALTIVPIDPYSGQPMRFTEVENQLTVYSTGKDLQDDGGRVDWQYGKQPGDFLFTLKTLPGTKPRPSLAAEKPQAEPAVTPPSETAATEAIVREWTSTAGTKVKAKFAGLDGDTAILARGDGKSLRVPLEKLVLADREWIKSQKK